MKWVNYVKKTSVARMVADWCEYMELKKKLYRAEKDKVKSCSVLVKYYDRDDNIRFGSACIKCKQSTKKSGVFVDNSCYFSAQRCMYFEPKGDEQKCPNNSCVMHEENNLYFENKRKYNECEERCSRYWLNKFANVK